MPTRHQGYWVAPRLLGPSSRLPVPLRLLHQPLLLRQYCHGLHLADPGVSGTVVLAADFPLLGIDLVFVGVTFTGDQPRLLFQHLRVRDWGNSHILDRKFDRRSWNGLNHCFVSRSNFSHFLPYFYAQSAQGEDWKEEESAVDPFQGLMEAEIRSL